MKKIIILISFALMTASLNAKPSFDERVVDDYITIAELLNMGTLIVDSEQPDAEKYALKALNHMKKSKMNMKSKRGATIYYQLGMIYYGMSKVFPSITAKKFAKETMKMFRVDYGNAIKMLKLSILNYEKSKEILNMLIKKGDSQYINDVKNINSSLKANKLLLDRIQKMDISK